MKSHPYKFSLGFCTLFFLLFSHFAQSQSRVDQGFVTLIEMNQLVGVKNYIKQGVDINSVNAAGFSPLMLALRSDSLQVADYLLEQPNLKIDQRNSYGEDALMYAALHGHLLMVKHLIELGASVNKPGWTALHYAATYGHTDICNLLIEESAYIDAESPNRTTPLMMAAKFVKRETVMTLINAGADPTPKNDAGLTAANFAEQAGDKELADWLHRREDDFRRRYESEKK